MAPLHLSTYLTLYTYLAIAYAGTSASIRVSKFVLIYDRQTKQKNFEVQKKGFPFEPKYMRMCMFSTK